MSDQLLQRAVSLMGAGRLDEAGALLQSLLRKHPGNGAVSGALSAWHAQKGNFDRAIFFAREAVAAYPDSADARINLARILSSHARDAEALREFEAALALAPAHADGWQRYAFALARANRHADAQRACDTGLAVAPADHNLLIQAAHVQLMRGLAHDAAATLRACLSHHPASYLAAKLLAFALTYDEQSTREETFEAHRLTGRLLTGDMLRAGSLPPAPRRADPERRLRVGFVSPDLREHPVARFLAAVVAHADRSRMEFAFYANGVHDDAMTAFFRERGFVFRRAVGVGSRRLAEIIRADSIDILFDLAGQTGQSAIGVFAYRPAPIQITWIGYPNTTGMPSMEYRIVDSLTDPAAEPFRADAFATETLLRLDPCFLCYTPDPAAPPVSPPPFERNGFVTFGSFNGYQKINDTHLRLWARVLAAVPGSRLLVKNYNLGQEETREQLAARLVGAGVPRERFSLQGPVERQADHLAAYAGVDIGLDTYPYNGTTTTCEALLMGVPVVTRVGEIHASRVGLSLLHAVGRPEWCADCDDRYVEIAAGLAGDRDAMRTLRASLRDRLLASTLCDAPAYTRRFEKLIREVWHTHCQTPG